MGFLIAGGSMHQFLKQVIQDRCNLSGTCKLSDFVDVFREYHSWSRGQILSELHKANYPVGEVNRTMTIGGLSLKGTYKLVDRSLVLAK
jgi:hypothetical protein